MNDSAASLYSAWFDALPAMFRSMMPTNSAGSIPPLMAAMVPGAQPFPADQVSQALSITSSMLGQLYQSFVPMLAQGGLGPDALKNLSNAATETYQKLQQAAAMVAGSAPSLQNPGGFGLENFGGGLGALGQMGQLGTLGPMMQPWNMLLGQLSTVANPTSDGSKLLQLGMQRTFGGLSDAFGLRPARELEEAFRQMSTAAAAKLRTQLEYLALWTEAWNDGTQRLVKELTAMGSRGERIESMLALIRLWAKNVDGAVHEAMQSERGLDVTAKVLRAATTHREQLQKAVGLLSQALHVPTREEMDLAYREIQELKRELRRVKKALPPEARKKLMEPKEGTA